MYLDDSGHVQWSGLTEYTDGAQAAAWRETYGAGCPEVLRKGMDRWVNAKTAYDAARANGASMGAAALAARKAVLA
jgi:hypothetical protein